MIHLKGVLEKGFSSFRGNSNGTQLSFCAGSFAAADSHRLDLYTASGIFLHKAGSQRRVDKFGTVPLFRPV